MLLFEDIKPGSRLRGLDSAGIAEVVQVTHFGPDALNLVFRVNGRVGERLVYRGDEASFELLEAGRTYAFDADGSLLRLASEAYRIRLAHLFDPYLAVSASQIEALPHQITAVYGEMLPRQPLRFLLADDPGAGKTIMAGLLIKELLIRGDLERCLIVAPGGLVEQWQEEMAEKFAIGFDILTRDQIEASITGNPFVERNRIVLRLDMAARSEELRAKLEAAPEWDLVICDEAHRMAASYFGGEVKETQRYKLGKLLGTRTRNLLLMSATPHNGKEADFQLFMGLLDADRFEGRFREGVHKADVSDMMRRLTKEELYRFDSTPLFPERRAYTASYDLSLEEVELYQAVTTYVREEMNRADHSGDGGRRNSVGFALQILQRRLASSPAAIYRSLERRRKRLEERLREERLFRDTAGRLSQTPTMPNYDPDDFEEAPGEELEATEEQIVDSATAAQTLAELEAEIAILQDLEARALRLKLSGRDTKWRELESILDDPMMQDPVTGLRRKLLIFTEPKDTLEYLAQKITARVGDPAAVVTIHGGVAREARRAAIAAFNSDPVVRVMIANDAAGEGVNLQRGAHLMVNYDLPWNPNRLEQRFGRIHRIGQTEVCHLWNLCAANTREGEVYRRLLEKLEEAREALGGKVYDVLGELFEGQALRILLVDAIRYGDRPDVKAELFRKVDGAVDVATIETLVAERKLTSEGLDPRIVTAIREEMERAQARRLQPHFIGAFFREAFTTLAGRIVGRENGRFEITRVPGVLKTRDRLIGRGDPVLDRYARVTFEKTLIAGQPQAELLAPGHPLLDAVVDVILERFQPLLNQGGVLVDESDERLESRLLVYLEHAIRDGRTGRGSEPRVVSQRLQFIHLKEDGSAQDGGSAPYLDYRPITAEERSLISDVINAPWLQGPVEDRALAYAVSTLVPDHLAEVKRRRLADVDKVEREVRARLTREINYWDGRASRLREDERAGKDQRINAQNAESTAQRMVDRLHRRQAELDRERQISALAPVLKGAVLVIPKGLLQSRLRPTEFAAVQSFAQDPDARSKIERLAMEAVMAYERSLGNEPRDVSAEKKGWDVESRVTTWKRAKIAVFVGSSEGPDVSLRIEKGPKVHTPWGYISWRLAGDAGLKLVAEAEAARTNPGWKLMVEVMKLAGPCIILLDELVMFARQLPEERFEAFLSFVQSLTEAAALVPHALIVGSLPESDAEAGGVKGKEALLRLEKVFGRIQSAWLPASGDETYEIIRRRLFQAVDGDGERARDATVRAFHDLYRKNPAEFPPEAKEPRYQELLRLSYPIHPELFDRLSKDWASLEKFQRTRGVLRFMANVVGVLWQAQVRDPLILPARIPIAHERVRVSALYPLDPAFSAVVDKEVDGETSLPARMEANPSRRISQARAATRAARAVFLCSAPLVGQPNAGLTGQGLRLACAEPGDQLAIFGEALRELTERATYLYEEAGRYWFSTQPTLNRLADDRAKALPDHEIDAAITQVLRDDTSSKGGFHRVFAAPEDPVSIDEVQSLSLVILGPSTPHAGKGVARSPATEVVTDTLMRCRASQRRYRNTLLFAAPDETLLGTVREAMRKAIAWAEIASDKRLQDQLPPTQMRDAAEKAKSNREGAVKAVRLAWSHVLFPIKTDNTPTGVAFELDHLSIASKDRAAIPAGVYEKAKADGITKEKLGPDALSLHLKPLWSDEKPHLSISEVADWFAAYVYLPKLRDRVVLDVAIRDGVAKLDPSFGYADRFNEASGSYDGLVWRKLPPDLIAPTGVIVRPEVAFDQSRVRVPSVAGEAQTGGPHTHVDGPRDMPAGDSRTTPRQPRRFFGSVEIDMVRPVKSFDQILNAVVAELQRTSGVKVKLTLEIEAEAQSGFAQADIDVVRDNTRQLKFKGESTGFED